MFVVADSDVTCDSEMKGRGECMIIINLSAHLLSIICRNANSVLAITITTASFGTAKAVMMSHLVDAKALYIKSHLHVANPD